MGVRSRRREVSPKFPLPSSSSESLARCKAAKTEQCVCDGGLEYLTWINYALKPDRQSFIHDTEVEIPLSSPNTLEHVILKEEVRCLR